MYSENERTWFPYVLGLVAVVCSATYASWGWRVLTDGWDQAGGTPLVITLLAWIMMLFLLSWASAE